MEFILVTADEMYLGFDEINEPGSLISCHNFLDIGWIQFYSPLTVKILSSGSLVLFWV